LEPRAAEGAAAEGPMPGAGVPASSYRVFFDQLPVPTIAVDPTGRVTAANEAAAQLVGDAIRREGARCCTLFGCRTGGVLARDCLTELTMAAGRPVERSPVWLAAEPARAVTVTAVPLRDGQGAIIELQLSDPPAGDATLRIVTLGRTRVEAGGRALPGDWLSHKPGQVLKYLVAARGRPVPFEELVDALWPLAGSSAISSVRQAVHSLRHHLESGRRRYAASRYVLGGRGHYELNTSAVDVDADRFEAAAREGLEHFERGDRQRAVDRLAEASRAYTGPFLADEPYADWALIERDRLDAVAGQALRVLAQLHLDAGDLQAAWPVLNRLSGLEPFDLGVQQQLLAVLIARGRHSEAARRCEALRKRFRRTFGETPDLELAEVAWAARELRQHLDRDTHGGARRDAPI
jgi:DNA-binding SARP family transcriptional activator